MADFVLIHGGAGTAAGWSPVREHLSRLGHESVAMDLPCDDPEAGYEDYARSVVRAASGTESPVVVAHSAGGFIAPLVAESLGASRMVLLSAMIPVPGETFEAWWTNTGHDRRADPDWEDPDLFYNGVPRRLAEEDTRLGESRENFPTGPWPADGWPDVTTKFLLCRDDRLFPPEFMRRVVRERLGIEAEEVDGGHCALLSHPEEIADKLDEYAKEARRER